MLWSNFIHIYQPPTQTKEIVEKVTNESYRVILKILKEHPNGKLTININASLTEQLARYGFYDVIEGLKELAQDNRIEFTGSAKYHPIMPLIPESEMIRQIELNMITNQKYFGEVYNPTGFFPPEMCYSRKVAEIVKSLGFKWIIIDEIGYDGRLGQVNNNKLHKIKGLEDFYVFFKEREFSAGITYGKYPGAKEFKEALNDRIKENFYLLSGTDGEMYGHHRPGQELLLSEVYENNDIKTTTISDLFTLYSEKVEVDPLPCSWSTWEKEMEEGIPYPQWSYPDNEIHILQWALAYTAINLITNLNKSSNNFDIARDLLDKGLHSCQWWWASCRPWWDTGMITKGAEQLFSSIETIKSNLSPEDIEKANVLKERIIHTAQNWWKTGKALQLKQEYKEKFTDVTTELTFG